MSKKTTQTVGSLVATQREKQGLSQSELASMAKVGKSTLSEMESGTKNSTFKTVAKVITALQNHSS